MAGDLKIFRLGIKELRSIARDKMLLGMVVVGFSLMVYPYFVSSTILLVAIGAALSAAPFFIKL